MKHLNTSRMMSRVFRGSVLALALILVACGGDADEPTPTATTDSSQAALPTVSTVDSTPDTQVSEEEITILEPEVPATAEASTPDTTEALASPDSATQADPDESLSTPADEAVDLTESGETEDVDVASTPPEDEGAPGASTPPADVSSEVGESTPAESVDLPADAATPPADTVATASVDSAELSQEASPQATDTEVDETDAQPTERARTGDETFDHPGDGTGGSGMPGENNVNEPEDEAGDTPVASPAASPVAQLEITGCEVPDVPGFLGDTSTFILTVDLNFRTGPGVDCEPVMDEPLGLGQTVEVIGGPVTQTEDDSEWVQIEIDGVPGWITTEFIEPVE